MPVFAFSVEKDTPWRGEIKGMSNVYHYDLDFEEPSEQVLDDMVSVLVAAEKTVYGTNVTFRTARVWGPVNSQGRGGSMRLVKALSGTGSATIDSTLYKECAFLCIWPLGRYGSRNRPQFLRKWIRAQSLLGATSPCKDGTTPINSTPAVLNSYMNSVTVVQQGTAGAPTSLCNASGEHSADTHYMYPYLEHRQFGS